MLCSVMLLLEHMCADHDHQFFLNFAALFHLYVLNDGTSPIWAPFSIPYYSRKPSTTNAQVVPLLPIPCPGTRYNMSRSPPGNSALPPPHTAPPPPPTHNSNAPGVPTTTHSPECAKWEYQPTNLVHLCGSPPAPLSGPTEHQWSAAQGRTVPDPMAVRGVIGD